MMRLETLSEVICIIPELYYQICVISMEYPLPGITVPLIVNEIFSLFKSEDYELRSFSCRYGAMLFSELVRAFNSRIECSHPLMKCIVIMCRWCEAWTVSICVIASTRRPRSSKRNSRRMARRKEGRRYIFTTPVTIPSRVLFGFLSPRWMGVGSRDTVPDDGINGVDV